MKRLITFATLFALFAAVPTDGYSADRGGKDFAKSGGSRRSSSFNRGSFSRGSSSKSGSAGSRGSSFGKRPTFKPTPTKRPSLGNRLPTKPSTGNRPPIGRPKVPPVVNRPPIGKPTFPPVTKPKFPPTKPKFPPVTKPKFPPTKPKLPPTKPQLPPWKPGKPPIVGKPPVKPVPPPTIPPLKPGKPGRPWFPPIVRPGKPWYPGPIVRPPAYCPGWNWGWGSCWQRPGHGFGFCYVRPQVVYVNPYCRRPIIGGCDYSIPCVPNAVTTEAGQVAFEKAVAAFRAGDHAAANAYVEVALREMPGNADVRMLHSLVLFATGRYEDAAAVAHTAMTASAGWDWETLSAMYASVDVYTAQLRKLEQASVARPDSADLRFLLGVHYLMCGHEKSAGRALDRVNTLEPKDDVAKQLTTMLAPKAAAPAAPPAPAAELSAEGDLTGTWTAQPASGVTITLRVDDDRFEWTLDLNGEKSQFDGTFTRTDDQLVLKRADGEELPVVLGNVTANSFDLTPEGGEAMSFTR